MDTHYDLGFDLDDLFIQIDQRTAKGRLSKKIWRDAKLWLDYEDLTYYQHLRSSELVNLAISMATPEKQKRKRR